MNRTRFFVSILLFFCPSASFASNIYLETTTPDPVGKLFAYELRERISASSRHKLVYDENEAAFKIAIVTLDANERRVSTVYSVVLKMSQFKQDTFDFYISNWVGTCGREVANQCAATVAAALDEEIQPIIEVFKKNLNSTVDPDEKLDGQTFS